MTKIFKLVNALALTISQETGKEVIAIRVFSNCLCIYFLKGSCRFCSKHSIYWGEPGNCYFTTSNFNALNASPKLKQQFGNLLTWTEEYINANYIQKMWLILEYNIKYLM